MILSQWFHLSYFRGREQCSFHNQAAYMKRCTQTTLDSLLCHGLSPELIALATTPLPTSHLFCEASWSADALDKSELCHWGACPPFSQPEPADTMQEAQFIKNLTHVFFGQKVHLENQAKVHRECRYRSGARNEIITELLTIVMQGFREWVRLKDSIAGCTARRHKEMATSLLQWHTWIIYSYYHEAGMLEQGENPY